MSHPPTTLVTGAGGFIGSALMRAAAGDLVGTTRDEVSLTSPAEVRALLEAVRPRRLVHLAGSIDKGASAADRERQWQDTFLAGRVLLEAAAEAGVRHIVAAGSIEELGSAEGVLEPDTPPRPVSWYGLCKSWVRELAHYHARLGAFRVDWFRPFIVYGPGQVRDDMLLPGAFRAAVEGRSADFTDGRQVRDFLLIDDLVAWLRLVLAVPLGTTSSSFEVHHLGSGCGVEVRQVLEWIGAAFPGADFHLGARARRPGEPSIQVAAPYRATEASLSRWKAQTALPEGIARTAAWWKQRHAGRAETARSK